MGKIPKRRIAIAHHGQAGPARSEILLRRGPRPGRVARGEPRLAVRVFLFVQTY